MKGWILRKTTGEIKPEYYELNRFIEVAKELNIELECLNPKQIEVVVDGNDRKSILVDEQVVSLPDFVIPRLGSATDYYTLAVIRHLERLGVLVINSSTSIETVKDKLYSMQILTEANLPTPKTILAKFPISSKLISDRIGFPTVIKTLSGSLGNGVFLAENKDKFDDMTDFIKEVNSNSALIFQEFIKFTQGSDLRVLVVGGRALKAVKRTAPEGSFKANISRGGSASPYEIDEQAERISIEAAKVLGLDVAGVDLLFDESGYKICEVNSSPGFTGLESANPDFNTALEIFNYVKFKLTGKL